MGKLFGSLSGYKTYIGAAMTVVGAWSSYLVGDTVNGVPVMDLSATIQLTVTAMLAVFIRDGIASTAKKGN